MKSDASINPDLLSLQHTLLFGLKGGSAYVDHAMKLGQEDDKDYQFIQDGLVATIDKRPGVKETLALLLPDTEERAGERPEPLLLRF